MANRCKPTSKVQTCYRSLHRSRLSLDRLEITMWTLAIIGLVVLWIAASYLACNWIARLRGNSRPVVDMVTRKPDIRRRAGYWTSSDHADSAD